VSLSESECVLCSFFSFQPLESGKAHYKGKGMERREPKLPHLLFCLVGTTSSCFFWKQNFYFFSCEETIQSLVDTDSDLPITLTRPPRCCNWFIDMPSIHFSSEISFPRLLCQSYEQGPVLTTGNPEHTEYECALLLGVGHCEGRVYLKMKQSKGDGRDTEFL
jgi:hypothetical protein